MLSWCAGSILGYSWSASNAWLFERNSILPYSIENVGNNDGGKNISELVQPHCIYCELFILVTNFNWLHSIIHSFWKKNHIEFSLIDLATCMQFAESTHTYMTYSRNGNGNEMWFREHKVNFTRKKVHHWI